MHNSLIDFEDRCLVKTLDTSSSEYNNNYLLSGIINFLKSTNSIEILDLERNNLADSEIIFLCQYLRLNSAVKKINLRGNRITKKGGYAIASLIEENLNLESIDLAWNNIGDMGAVAILNAIKKSKSIREINISWNSIRNWKKIKSRFRDVLKEKVS